VLVQPSARAATTDPARDHQGSRKERHSDNFCSVGNQRLRLLPDNSQRFNEAEIASRLQSREVRTKQMGATGIACVANKDASLIPVRPKLTCVHNVWKGCNVGLRNEFSHQRTEG
jgi:hypothetical protein